MLTQAATLGGSLVVGPDKVAHGFEIGCSSDPEAHVIGLMKITPREG